MKEKLLEKLRMYQDMKVKVLADTYDIEAKVQEYRTVLMRECERDRAKKIEKIDTYTELLEKLIEEAEQEEKDAECQTEAPVEEAVVEEVAEEIKEEGV